MGGNVTAAHLTYQIMENNIIINDAKNLVTDTFNSKIIGVFKNAQVFNADDVITTVKKIVEYDIIKTKLLETIDNIEKEL